MTAAFKQFVKQQLAVAKRDYQPDSEQYKAAEQAYVNAGGIPGDVEAAGPNVAAPETVAATTAETVDNKAETALEDANNEEPVQNVADADILDATKA